MAIVHVYAFAFDKLRQLIRGEVSAQVERFYYTHIAKFCHHQRLCYTKNACARG